MTKRDDGFEGWFEYLCYDTLNRLTNSATGNTATSCTSSGTGIATKTVGYDTGGLGNIASRSDVGTYSYPASGVSSVRPHAVSAIAGTVNGTTNPNYSYDANGNQACEYTGASCTGSNIVRATSYTSYNMANTITLASTTIAFTYDAEHNRIGQCIGTSCATSMTTYLNDPVSGAASEKVVSGATTTWHDYIQAGSQIVAERFCTGAAPCSTGATARYFVADHLGSTSVLTDGTGSVTERDSYDAWGKRRNANGTDDTTCSLTSATTRGFTAQEHIDAACAINFNACIYDPTIGRFMSADSVVPDALNGQAYNRYSYVENWPLSMVDPTGHDDEIETVVVTGKLTVGTDLAPTSIESGNFGGLSTEGSFKEKQPKDDAGVETVVVTGKKYTPPPIRPVTVITIDARGVTPIIIDARGHPSDLSGPYGHCSRAIVAAANQVYDAADKTEKVGEAGTIVGAIMIAGGALFSETGVGSGVAVAGYYVMMGSGTGTIMMADVKASAGVVIQGETGDNGPAIRAFSDVASDFATDKVGIPGPIGDKMGDTLQNSLDKALGNDPSSCPSSGK